MTSSQKFNLSFHSSKFSLLLSFAKYVHFSMCSWVSLSPVVQCMQLMSSLKADDLQDFFLLVILLLILNQVLVSLRVIFFM